MTYIEKYKKSKKMDVRNKKNFFFWARVICDTKRG